jgi:lipopolysaccharide biosynthesis glycosyltransferase
MAVDRKFGVPLAVALTSLAEAHPPGSCNVTVLDGGLPTETRARIEADLRGRLGLEWIAVDEDALLGMHFPAWLSKATLYRLLLPQLLPELDRTIYLDADTVVLEPLTPLWEMELGDHAVAAARDAGVPWAAGTNWRDLGIPPETPYFNGGLLVIPLDLWRREQIAEAATELLRRAAPRWADQCALNCVTAGRWLEIPKRWNLQTSDIEGRGAAWALWRAQVEEAVADPAVIHYSEPAKPWSRGAPHPRSDLWFEFLDRTSWAGWRPPEGEPFPTRVVRKARRFLKSFAPAPGGSRPRRRASASTGR